MIQSEGRCVPDADTDVATVTPQGRSRPARHLRSRQKERIPYRCTHLPSCAVSTGLDSRQPRHEQRHPIPSRRRRQDPCARIAVKNAIPRHQRRQLVFNHPDRREDGCHSKANCTSGRFESHSTAGTVPYDESRMGTAKRRFKPLYIPNALTFELDQSPGAGHGTLLLCAFAVQFIISDIPASKSK